ncbi:MAG TPA: hypothetical protein VF789_22535 [Thermoanaerobaculia bacterium]
MPRSGFRRWRAVLLLAALLPLALNAAHARETPRRAAEVRAAAANPLAPLWDGPQTPPTRRRAVRHHHLTENPHTNPYTGRGQ